MNVRVEDVIAALAGVHERSVPDIDQRTAAWWWGAQDDEVVWWLCMAGQAAREPVAGALYLAHVAEDLSRTREIKHWAYGAAVDIARERHRGRDAVESYALRWGHQAARDGVALALWPHLAEYVPGYASRARCFGCASRAYLTIREGVLYRTRDIVSAFRYDMDCLRKGMISQGFLDRHAAGAARHAGECATGFKAMKHTDSKAFSVHGLRVAAS